MSEPEERTFPSASGGPDLNQADCQLPTGCSQTTGGAGQMSRNPGKTPMILRLALVRTTQDRGRPTPSLPDAHRAMPRCRRQIEPGERSDRRGARVWKFMRAPPRISTSSELRLPEMPGGPLLREWHRVRQVALCRPSCEAEGRPTRPRWRDPGLSAGFDGVNPAGPRLGLSRFRPSASSRGLKAWGFGR
jgi:hypothetical protein